MKFEIVLTDPFVVDSKSEVFNLWLDCIPKNEAVDKLLESYIKDSKWPEIAEQHKDNLKELFDSDTTDQYRMFTVLERYLKEPLRLRTQRVCYLDSRTQRVLIRNYYNLDPQRILDLIKLYRDQRGRSHAHKPLPKRNGGMSPLTRQLRNVQRIEAVLKDNKYQGNVLELIQGDFCLSPDVAADYAHLIFFLHHNILVLRRDGLREKAILPWQGMKDIADAIQWLWCSPSDRPRKSGDGDSRLARYLELDDEYCESVAVAASRVRNMVARSSNLTSGASLVLA